jgi:RHS repeat-associated protein
MNISYSNISPVNSFESLKFNSYSNISSIESTYSSYSETLYSYFGARYYNSGLGIWLSVDPLASKYPSLSPYAYCANNPIKYIDPDGRSFGDFYDQKGKYLGTDGINDGNVYIVTNKTDAKAISKANKSGGTTNLSNVSSAVALPSKSIRSEMSKVVGKDSEDSFREYGGVFGTDVSGNEKLVWANPGARVDPSKSKEATIDVFDAANPSEKGTLSSYAGTFHSHPSGTVTVGQSSGTSGMTTIGGTSTTYSFNQFPSPEDINSAGRRSFVTGNNYVFGTGNKTVYIYNGNGIQATFPIDKFGTVGR